MYPAPESSPFFLRTDESTNEEEPVKPKTKEKSDLKILCSWMEVGASSQTRERGTGAFVRSEFLFPSLEFLCGFLLLAIFKLNFFLLPLHFSSSFRGWTC